MLSVNDATRASEPFRLVEDDVVVFLGGTNMLYLQEAGYLEAMLTRAFVESRPKFRDFTWEADTQMPRIAPTLLINTYENDIWRQSTY